MTDSALNYFVASGTNAERLAFTPSPPTPAAGPDPGYIWKETDTGNKYMWDPTNGTWSQINVAGTAASTTEVLTGTDSSKYVSPDALAALWEQGGDITSAGTISVGEGGFFHVTGTVTITDIDFATTKAGRTVVLEFDGALILTHNSTTLILPTGANITTAAGDVAGFVSEGGDNVRCTFYQRKSGAALVGGGSGALTLITETVTSGSAADVTFSSIPATYRDLEIRVRGRSAGGVVNASVRLQFNGDTGSNYHSETATANAGSVSSAESLSTTSIARTVDIPGASSTANYTGVDHIIIGDYRGTTFFKAVAALGGQSFSTSSGFTQAQIGGGQWLSTAAINAVKVFLSSGNWVDGSVVSLYGRM